MLGGLGTYHVSDIPIDIGSAERKATATKNEPEQDKMIKTVMTAWAAFAKVEMDLLVLRGRNTVPRVRNILNEAMNFANTTVEKSLVRLRHQNRGQADFAQGID